MARALVVVNTLIKAGVAGEAFSAASFGQFRPQTPNDTEEGRKQNRRIEIVVVPDLSALPGYDEMQQIISEGAKTAPANR